MTSDRGTKRPGRDRCYLLLPRKPNASLSPAGSAMASVPEPEPAFPATQVCHKKHSIQAFEEFPDELSIVPMGPSPSPSTNQQII